MGNVGETRAGIAGWIAWGAVILLGLAGAASSPSGLLIGVPWAAEVALAALATAALAAATGVGQGRPALAAARVQRQVGPEGDEPHDLMVAASLPFNLFRRRGSNSLKGPRAAGAENPGEKRRCRPPGPMGKRDERADPGGADGPRGLA